jgi:hypothetical protein
MKRKENKNDNEERYSALNQRKKLNGDINLKNDKDIK